MSFSDDEPIVALPNAGPRPIPIVAGRVQLVSKNNSKAPLDENTQKVMLELTGGDSTADRGGLDLVAVLDVSGSMAGEKLQKMMKAMEFVIRKLSPIDRLSIVSFSSAAHRLCPLRQVTETSQPQLQGMINKLVAKGGTNIADGLRTAVKVLADRSNKVGRVHAVILMSDGEQNQGDASTVATGGVPVYTFGFGEDYDPNVLNAVARNSKGGTFAVVDNVVDGLSKGFSQILAGLVTVVVSDLKLTVSRIEDESTIQSVSAGIYDQEKALDGSSVTISFGDLYAKEVRKTIVDVLLPTIDTERGADILEISYAYTIGGKLFDAPPGTLTVRRSGGATADAASDVQTEEARLNMADKIKAARTMADGKNIVDARDKLVEAQNALEDVVEQTNPLVDALRNEIQQLVKLFKTQDVYDRKGRPFALSSETSHDRQRFAARGDIDSIRLFATPRMDKYLEQAKKFDENPAAPLPSVDEDVKEEIAANPLGPIAGPISFYIQTAIQALQAIDKLINKGANQ
ncbi:hypothetical protein KC19_2G148600 [Ceratodon purpureus]|uniref:VWFA domain-containing protein n=1 Tax=Ceratodon purpureus TaxID=3225 RepID=A0A8T0IVR2_CERPU|nr:hypothetical protein KC19_2G148600 [Ceratodon purpureus]